jgi:4-alpha-glucanotransferase
VKSGRRNAPRPRLRELADRVGIIPEYLDQTGRYWRKTTDAARELLLAIMGFDAPSEDAARGWLAELDHEERGGLVDSVRVVERDAAAARRVPVRIPPGWSGAARVRATITEEGGTSWTVERAVRRAGTLALPAPLPYGYHTVRVAVSANGREEEATQSLIVVPRRCVTPDARLGDARAFGVVANLYAVRHEGDWGIGDSASLHALVEFAAGRGADFVGINPLHALFNRGTDVSPYSPVSRLFRNHIYIDAHAVEGMAETDAGRELLARCDAEAASLRALPAVDYDGVLALKERALREAHRRFRDRGGSDAFEAFVREREPELTRFATWMSIAESAGSSDWRAWPASMSDPESSSVVAYREANAERVDFHRWAQFELQRQLADVAGRARVLGMRIGVYQDLAIGTNPGGSDTWSYPDLFLRGASIGAPPDPYSSTGQNWGLPPMDPRVLRAQCYRYWVQLLRRAFEHAGALRIDHVMGLFRSFWIPDGGTGLDGAYVRFPSADLLGILALESVRHDALVVGEDLGTVPKDVPPAMKKWGVLSSKVLYFEKQGRAFKPAAAYPPLSLATANTHDMAPLAGFWRGRDLEIRRAVGLVDTDARHRAAVRERDNERLALLERVRLDRAASAAVPAFPALTAAVHRFLCDTRARLVGMSWDDILGESDPVNVPGVGPDRYPSWRRRNRMTIEEASWRPEVDQALGCDARRRSG